MDEDKNELEKDNSDIKEKYKKQRDKKRNASKIFGIVFLVCFASLIVGTTFGFGFGIANKLFDRFVINKNKQEQFVFDNDKKSSESVGIESDGSYNSNRIFSNKTESLQDIIERVSNSVVAINTVSESRTNDLFSRFFFGYEQQPYQEKGSGSGIIFYKDDDKLYISTNSHVISGANSVEVIIDSKTIDAKFLGKNIVSDLAVIYLEKKDFEANNLDWDNIKIAQFGNSDNIRVGEKIIAIGNAMGEGNSVTEGIVSVKNKEITVDDKKLNMIQVDASVNPGNSGGALINTKGEVIGVTTAKYTRFAVEGMSYCIPSNTAKSIIEEIMNEPSKPYLGIKGIDITDEISNNYGLPKIGVVVVYVEKDSNAQKYGLQVNDVITMIDGQSVHDIKELSDALSKRKIGDKIKLHVMRHSAGAYHGIDLNVNLDEHENSGF